MKTVEEMEKEGTQILKALAPTRKEKRAFKKMRRKHKKELRKLIKEDVPWNWECLHELIVLKIKQTYEYFEAGNCIIQAKEGVTKVLQSINKVLNILNQMNHCDDAYNAYNEQYPMPFPRFELCGEDGLYKIVFDEPDEIHKERHRIWTESKENYAKLFEKFYKELGKQMPKWFD